MADQAPTVSELIQQLPQKLQVRFNSLGNYVQWIIDQESANHGKDIRFSVAETQMIQLAAFLYSLDRFLRAGSNAARTASLTFENLGLEGFQVGSTHFTRNNPNTRRGEILAGKLIRAIANTPLDIDIKNSASMRDLVTTLISRKIHGQSLG